MQNKYLRKILSSAMYKTVGVAVVVRFILFSVYGYDRACMSMYHMPSEGRRGHGGPEAKIRVGHEPPGPGAGN